MRRERSFGSFLSRVMHAHQPTSSKKNIAALCSLTCPHHHLLQATILIDDDNINMTSTSTEMKKNKRAESDKGRTGKEDASPSKRQKQQATAATAATIRNEYQGYSFQSATTSTPLSIDVVQTCSISAKAFFDQYIRPRKPCVLDGLPTLMTTRASTSTQNNINDNNNNGEPIAITRELLESLAGDKVIQVERKCHADESFGQNRDSTRQIQLTVREFLNKLLDSTDDDDDDDDYNRELLYWSTQEEAQDDDPFAVPCRQLLDQEKIPSSLPLAGNLLLNSCNLWMGASTNGASSGLHHDYHDNFYLLLQGTKRFRLLSPDCAPDLHVHGVIECIHINGRISYVGKETRADGVPLQVSESDTEDQDDDNDEDEEEEEVVLGKGFDYVSSEEEEEVGFDQANQTDDFEEIMRNEDEGDDNGSASSFDDRKNQSATTDDHTSANVVQEGGRPDSFSKINPCQSDQTALHKEFPSYSNCRQVMVHLKAGQQLYLPAGWFHEVTSKSSSSSSSSSSSLGQCHMALNYWYHPPDALDNFDNPYQSDFWKKQEQRRLKKISSRPTEP
jgi:Cupin-like domain